MNNNLSVSPRTVAQDVQPTAISPIPNPDQAYLDATTKIDISQLNSGSLYNSITDGTLTVTFSNPVEKLGPVPDGWATWSSPPESESANPDVLYREGNNLTMILSSPVTIFGFELEPFFFGLQNITVDFYNNNTLLDSIFRMVNGNAGARLIALESTPPDLPINRVVITAPDQFAIAQVRYQMDQGINETLLLLALLLLILLLALLLL
jgi:hypothetical protein